MGWDSVPIFRQKMTLGCISTVIMPDTAFQLIPNIKARPHEDTINHLDEPGAHCKPPITYNC